MLESDFRNYLRNVRNFKETTVNGRIANCRRVERYEGDLDRHFDNDQCRNLLWRLTYSAEDRNQQRPLKHDIPINGNALTGTARLKQAVTLYVQFLSSRARQQNLEENSSLHTYRGLPHDDTPQQRRATISHTRGRQKRILT